MNREKSVLTDTSSSSSVHSRLLGNFVILVIILTGFGPWTANASLASVETDLVRTEVAQSLLDAATIQVAQEALDAADTADREAAALGQRVDTLRAEHAGLPQRI